MMSKLQTIFTAVCALLLVVLIPQLSYAQTGLVPCDTNCGFEDLIQLAQNVINFLIFKIAAPLGTIMFAYAGFLYVTNAGNESRVSEAHQIFWYVFWGLVVCLAAWLIVNFVLVFLLGAGSPYNLIK